MNEELEDNYNKAFNFVIEKENIEIRLKIMEGHKKLQLQQKKNQNETKKRSDYNRAMERNKKVNSRQRRKKPLGSNITQMQKKKIFRTI